MGNIYYDPPNGVAVHVPLALRHHADREQFLDFLSGHEAAERLLDFTHRLFSEETIPSAEISPVFELMTLALDKGFADLAGEFGDLADSLGY